MKRAIIVAALVIACGSAARAQLWCNPPGGFGPRAPCEVFYGRRLPPPPAPMRRFCMPQRGGPCITCPVGNAACETAYALSRAMALPPAARLLPPDDPNQTC